MWFIRPTKSKTDYRLAAPNALAHKKRWTIPQGVVQRCLSREIVILEVLEVLVFLVILELLVFLDFLVLLVFLVRLVGEFPRLRL